MSGGIFNDYSVWQLMELHDALDQALQDNDSSIGNSDD